MSGRRSPIIVTPPPVDPATLASNPAFAALFVDKATYATTGWTDVANAGLGAGWANQGDPYQSLRHCLYLGLVLVEGLVQNTTLGPLGAGDPIYALPAGRRPNKVIDANPFNPATLEIDPAGVIRVNSAIPSLAWVSCWAVFRPV